MHRVWHVFVLAGSISHYVAILAYVWRPPMTILQPRCHTVFSAYWQRCAVLACALCVNAGYAQAEVSPADSLRAHYAALGDLLSRNQFQQPLHLDSVESPGNLKGEIYALVDYPFEVVNAELTDPSHWCDVLILHINIKYCRATTSRTGTVLAVNIGTKREQSLDIADRLEFDYRVTVTSPEYFEVRLNADRGPLGTRDFRIDLEAVPIGDDKSFLHLSYSYSYGFVGLLAMKIYLATIGSNKVGFTIVGRQADGRPVHIGGVRGLVERNTMRYHLAIEAYLNAVSAQPAVRLEKRLDDWFSATERYPRQLYEMDRTTYLTMKRREYLRQQTAKE